jgi:hypothetical protein
MSKIMYNKIFVLSGQALDFRLHILFLDSGELTYCGDRIPSTAHVGNGKW